MNEQFSVVDEGSKHGLLQVGVTFKWFCIVGDTPSMMQSRVILSH